MSSDADDGRPIRVVIVDDHPMFLDGIRADLDRPGMAPLAGLVLTEFRRASAVEQGDPALTARENEVLRLVAQGHSYGEIGQQLYISPKTVRNHVQNILRKLQLGKRYELMRYAIERGLDT